MVETIRLNKKFDPFEAVRQSVVVMKNEIKKYFSGKRMLIFVVLLAALLAILTITPYILEEGGLNQGQMLSMYLTLSPMIVLMAATLFASITIVAEYEERTALIVFTRPISKASIFMGKAMAAYVVSVAFIILYYLYATVIMFIQFNAVDEGMFTSLGIAMAYAFGCIGIAMAISGFMKKSNTATILTFVVLMILITAISMVLTLAGVDASWMIDQASGSIASCSPGYREYTDAQYQQMAAMMMNPGTFIDFNLYAQALNPLIGPSQLTAQQLSDLLVNSGAWSLKDVGEFFMELSVEVPDIAKDILTMFTWGILAFIVAFIQFCRREF